MLIKIIVDLITNGLYFLGKLLKLSYPTINAIITAIVSLGRGCMLYKSRETKYFKQELIQRRFDFSGVLYFGWPNQPSSGTMRVYMYIE